MVLTCCDPPSITLICSHLRLGTNGSTLKSNWGTAPVGVFQWWNTLALCPTSGAFGAPTAGKFCVKSQSYRTPNRWLTCCCRFLFFRWFCWSFKLDKAIIFLDLFWDVFFCFGLQVFEKLIEDWCTILFGRLKSGWEKDPSKLRAEPTGRATMQVDAKQGDVPRQGECGWDVAVMLTPHMLQWNMHGSQWLLHTLLIYYCIYLYICIYMYLHFFYCRISSPRTTVQDALCTFHSAKGHKTDNGTKRLPLQFLAECFTHLNALVLCVTDPCSKLTWESHGLWTKNELNRWDPHSICMLVDQKYVNSNFVCPKETLFCQKITSYKQLILTHTVCLPKKRVFSPDPESALHGLQSPTA